MGTSVLPGQLGTGCPPGFVIDYFTGECVPDPLNPFPIDTTFPVPVITGVTQAPGPTTSTESNTTVTPGVGSLAIATANATAINDAVNNFTIQNNVDTGPIGSAINSGIGNVVNAVNQANQQVASTIQGTVGQFANGLFSWATDVGKWLVQHIADVLRAIGSQLKSIVGTVIDTVSKAVSGAVTALSNTIGPLISHIADDIQKVVSFYQDHIQPILSTINTVVQDVVAVEKAIQADLHAGIQGLLNLPTDIANGLQQIDQALIRAGRALKVHRAEDADFYFVTTDGKGFAEHIKSLGESVIGLAPSKEKTTYSPGKESLSEPTLAQELPALLNSVYTILADVCKGIKSTTHDWTGVLELLGLTGAGLAISFTSPILLLGTALAMVRGPFNVVSELAEQRAFQAAPIRKLEPSELVEAVRRSFIDAKTMDAEMALQGYDSARSDLLRRLSVFLEPAGTLVDYLYRQIITDQDFAAGLTDLGYTPDQVAAAREASNRILDVQDILTAWRRNEADEKTVDDTLRANRFTDAQTSLLKGLAFSPASYAEAYRYAVVHRFLNFDNIPLPTLDEIPQVVKDGGRADGLNDDAILARWTGALNTLDPSQWLTLYFRQQAKLEEVNAALLRERVPQELWVQWIDSQRPIIPFRTIPSMIKAGILTESQGLQKLQAHGYSLEDATLLIRYAGAAASKSKSALASTQHVVSISVAKQLYADQAITKDQYALILKEHGFDAADIALEVQLSDLQIQAAARRAFGTDTVNEFEAGALSHDDAVKRLETSNLTQAEQAKYIRQLRTSKASKSKTPSEPELRQMAIHGVITVDDYETSVVDIGFSPSWAAKFRSLHFSGSESGTSAPNVGVGG